MNKNIKLQELKRWLKSSLKNKVSINDKTVIAFLMTGFLGLSTVAQADYVISDGNGSNFKVGMGNITTIRGRTTHNYSRERNLSVTLTEHIGPETDRTRNGETIEKVTLVGIGTRAIGAQAVGVGSNAVAAYQGTALGSDVFATGHSSIAIGNDDISTEYKDTLDDDTIEKIYRDGKTATTSLNDGLSWADFQGRYMGKSGNIDRRVWSPTFARGKGSIAIGSRTVAYADGTTALGTLSFALGDRSTAVGLRAYTHFGADGSTAIGEEARTFAKNTISIGNKTEATSDGSLAFGNLSRAVGNGSIAIGESVASNALLDNDKFELLKNKIDHYTDYNNYKSGNDNKLVDAGFASRQSRKIVSGYINSIVNDVQKFLYQHEGNLVIKTTDDIYKTKKLGDHAISLGYYLLNTGDNTIGIGTASRIHGANSVAIGALNVIDESAANSIAIGVGTRVEKENTLAFGTGALGLGAGSIILGAGAVGTKDNTISIGYGSESKSLGSLAMGSGTKVAENSNASLAIGNNSSIGTKSANATAIGIGAKVANDTQQGMAIGNKAEANLVNSTALGFESRTDYSLTDLSEPGYTPRGSYTIPTSARTGIISVGRIGEERRITNLASGYRDTDAVNVAQLRALEDRFEFSVSGFDDKTINYVSINSDGGDAGRVKEIALREIQYKEYVKLKKLEATLEVRKQSGDNLDPAKVKELYDRIRELENGTNGQRFKNAAIDLIDTIGKIKRTNNNPYFTNGQSGANFKRDEAYAHIDRDEATANNNISSIVSDDERNITKDTNFDNKGAKASDALSIGYKAFVEEGSENSIAIGKESKINKNTKNSVAIGYKASAGVSNNNPVTDAIAIGQQTKAYGNYSVVLGYKSQVDNAGGIAIGKEAKTHNSSASAIAIGDGAQVSNAEKAIAIGNGASVSATSGNSNFSIAIGDGSQVTSGYSVAVGKSSKATDTGTSAFGENSKATAERATAIGNNSNAAGKNAVALAFQASASGENSTALGHKANTSATNATALGANSSASIDGSVAIGAYSEATVNKDVNGYDPETNANSTNNNATWKATNAAVSVGHRRNNNEITRQITNVAAGTHDTDAVNVAQLRKLRDAAIVKYFSVNSSKTGNKNNNGAINNDTVAIGPNAKAEGHNSIAIGHNATTQNGASFAYGHNVTVRGDNSIGIGADINFTEDAGAKPDYTVAIGSSISIGKHSSYSVAIGRNAKITQVGSVAVGENAKAENDRATSIGNNTSTTVVSGIALGYQSVSNRAGNDNANIGYDVLTNAAKTSPDAIWKATHGALSIGDTGKTRQITNVAAGSADTDAVNVAQLKQVKLQYRSQNSTGNASSKQSATIAQGLLFKSGSNELKINAKANGEVEFKVELPTSPDNKLTFKAENSTEFERKNSQDKKVEIVSGDFSVSQGAGAGVNYKAKNLATKLDTTAAGAAIKIGLKDEVEFTKVSINSGTAQGPTLSTSGIDMGNKNISNLSKGTANDHAVRFDQLKELDGVTSDKILSKLNKGNVVAENGLAITGGTGTNRLLGTGELKIGLDTATKAKIDALPDDLPENIADATKSITFKASNDGTTFVRTNNQDKTLTVTEGNIGADYVGTNLKTSIDTNGNLKIGFKKAATFDSVSIPNGPSLSSTGLNMGGKPISNLGDASGDKDAPTYKQLKDLVGVLESTVTSKVQKGNLVAEDGIQINDGSGTDRLIGTGTLKVGLTQATKDILAKVGTGVISTTDPNKANTVTGEAVQNALNNLTIKYNDGKQGSVAKASKLSDGLKFVSKSDNLTIEAKDGGSIEFTITDELDKDLTDLTDDGKNVIKNQAIQAVKVVKDTTNTGNPITVTEDDTVANTKTYKIGIDNDKLKAAVGLPTGTVTKDSKDAVTGGKIFDAIKTAKTLVDKKDGETFITVEKTESDDDITANSYKIGLNITPLSAELAKTFAKQDASNITTDTHKAAWRNALNVYDKPEVDAKVKAATEKVENAANSILTVSDEAGVDGLGKTYKVGLTADKVKEVAGTDTLGNLGVDENDLTITGDGVNRLLGAGNVSISLSQAVKQTLGKVGTGVISETDANKDKTVTGKAVYDYVNPIKTDVASLKDNKVTFKASDNTATTDENGFVRKNNQDATITITEGNIGADYVENNLKTSIDNSGNIKIGFRKAPKFESLVVGSNTDDTKNVNINNNGIDLKEKGITGLTKGKADNEAVNVSQLTPLATALGTTVNAQDGSIAAPTYTLENGKTQANADGKYNTVGSALGALDSAITNQKIKYNDGGTNAAKETLLSNGLNFKSTSQKLTIKAKDNGELEFTVNVPDDIPEDVADGTKSLTVKASILEGNTNPNGYVKTNNDDRTITIIEGDITDNTDKYKSSNLKTSIDANGVIKIGLKENPSFKSISATDSIEVAGITLNNDGIAMGNKKITGLAKGTANTDAVTKEQLQYVLSKLGGGYGTTAPTIDGNGNVTGPVYKLMAGEKQPTDVGATPITKDYANVGEALKALDTAIEHVKNAEFTDKGKEDVRDLAREAVKVKAKDGDNNAITVNPIKTKQENTTYELFVEKTDSIAANAGTDITPAPEDQDAPTKHPNRLVTEKAVVDFVKPLENATMTFKASHDQTQFVRGNSESKVLTITEGNINHNNVNFVGNNLKTSITDAGVLTIGLKEIPSFKGVTLDPVGDGSKTITMTPTADGSGIKFEKSPEDPKGDKRVTIEGVKDGTSPDSVVTKGTFDQIVGRDGKDGKDGRNGTNGFDGNEVTQPESLVGPAGKDGLNGTSVNEKANALRRGEAGPVVFTTEDGTRIAKARDGKLFKKENVTPNGDLTDGTYVKVGEDYYKKSQLDENGLVREGEEKITDQDELAAATAAIDAIANAPISPENVRHSLVNIDGSTQENPSVLSNIASGINPEEIGKNEGAITEEKATNNVKTLLGLADKSKLNTAATVGDLQAVAKAGLNFKGNVATNNNEATTHRALTETLEIVGKDGETSFDNYTTNNVATKVSSGKIEIGFRKAPKFDSLIIGTNTDDSKNVSISDTGITMGNKKITGLAKGTDNTDAVTKEQLQDVLSKLGGGDGTTAPTIDGTGAVTGPVYKLMAGQKQPTKEEADNGAQPVTSDYANVGTALKALDQAIENVKNAEFTEKGAEDVRNLAREAVKVKAKEDANNAITVNPIKTTKENTTYELFVEKTDSIAATDITPAPADQDAPTKHPNRLVTEKAVVDYVATKVTPVANNTLTFAADNSNIAGNTDVFARKNSEDKTVSIKATTNAITVGTSADKYLGNNLTTKLVAAQDGKSAEILIGLKESPQFKDVFATEKIAIGTPTQSGPALTKDGIDGGNKPVFNVAKGVNNDDVITVSQLKPLLDRLGATLKTDGTDDNGQKDKNGTVTVPGFELKTGAEAPNDTKTYDTIGDALTAIDEKLSKTATGSNKITFSDGNANNNFDRENNEDKTIEIKKADDEKNIDVTLSKNQNGTVGTFKVGLASDLKEITSITNGDGTNSDTKSKIALADDTVKVSVQGKDLTITKVGEQGKEGISITGLEVRDIDSDNYGIDANKTRAATEGAVKHLSDVLGGNVTIVNKIGPAGKDGLDGKTIVEKVEGLRDGQSGPIVYTDQNGKRLVKDPATGEYFVMNNDGTPDKSQKVEPENVRLSMVDPAGETTKPITIGNLASALGLDKPKDDQSNYTKPISEADAKDVIGGLLTKSDDLNRAVTLADLQALAIAGLDFTGNTTLDGAQNVKDNTTHRKLSQKLTIIGKEQVASFDTYSTDNLATRVSEGKIEIGMLKTPRFDALELGTKGTNPDKKITLTPDAENGKLTLGKVTTPEDPKVTNPEKVVLDGLAAGTEPDSAVTKAQLDELAKKVGGTEEDVTDGRNGANGLDGEKVQDGNAGAAGKDGLNGKDLNEKVNALRRGEAGPVVYTTEDGERLVKGLDGKLYKPEDIKDKVFIEGKGYVAEADKDDVNATPVEAYALSANKDKVRHSLVNIDGSTTEPSVLANVASGIGAVVTSKAGVDPEVKFTTGSEDVSITPDKATKVTEALLGIDKKAKLNTAATVGDLQAIAQAGMNFGANTGDAIHRTLGTKLDITGKKDNVFDENEHSFDNVVTKIDTEDDANAIRIAFAKKPKFEEIKLQGPGNDKPVISIKPTDDGIKFTKDPANPDDKVVISGVKPGETEDSVATKGEILEIIKEIGGIGKDGKDGKDGRDGSKGLDGKDTENFGPAGKDGLNGQPIHERVNALRRGEAGPVVYTDPLGNRLIKGYDGKLYKQQDLVDKVYVENVGFIPKDQAEKKPDGTYIVKADVDAPTVTDPFALTEHADKVKHSLVNIDGTTDKPSKLSNLADGEISATSTDAINGSQLFKLVGDSTKDGKDGRNGDNGLDGAPAADKDAGLAGKDGLNGKDLNEKVNALRRGEAGAIVFTKDDGTRLAKANDGKLYDKENVTASGDLTAGDYVKVGDEYFRKDQLDENGKVLPGEVAINEQAEIEKAKEAIDALTSTNADDVVHSLVNIDGTTNNPSVLKNIASGINPEIIGKLDEAISLENANKVIAGDPADDQDKGLLGLADKAKLNTAATVGDLQALAKAGLNFAGNVGDPTHRSLTETLTIVGTNAQIDDFDKSHSTINVATRVTEGKIEVGFRKAPEFEELKLKSLKAGDDNKAVTLTPSEDGDKLTIKGPNGPVELDGIKAGTSPNSAVNKAQLDELANKLGDVAKDGEDGRNGSKGLDGQAALKGDVGPAGRDGLNGKDLNEKVNALRRGEAGAIVYTDLEGNRLVKGLDGKLYKADELENKVYVDGTGYVDEAKADKQKDGTYTLKPNEQADAVEAFNPGENNENVRLSGVNIDGSTNTPTELANIASGLGLNGKKPNSNDNYAKPITIGEAQGVVAGNNDNPGGLVGLTDDAKLNKVATVRDLQALAIAGMEFGANGDQKIHRTLGTKIDITGKKDNTFSEDKFSFDNVVTKVDTESTNNAIRIAIAKVPRFDALELGAKPLDENTPDSKITITPNTGTGTISFKNDPGIVDPNNTGNPADTKVVIDGIKDGNTPDSAVTKGTVDKIIELVGGSTKDGEDGRNGINGLDGNKVQDGNAGAAGKDGLNGKDLNEKVNALRRGEAGPVVYTTEDGERLVKGFDGKLYKPEDIKDKVFVEGVGYVNETDAKLENGVYVLADNVEEDTVDKVEAYALEANKDKVRHSLVNIDGETTNPSILSNVASGIDHKSIGTEDKAITADIAKANVDKLLSLDKMAKLNTAATVGDLQALAQAGINFGANNGNDIHRTLGSRLSIVGHKDEFTRINALEETEKATELAKYLAKFTDKNVITTTNNDEISIKLAERPEFKGIDVVDEANPDNKVSIDTTGTTVIGKDGNNFVRTITGKDGIIVKKTSDEAGNTDLDPKEEAKYGLEEASIQKGDKKVTINPEEIVISDTSADDTENAGKLKLTKDKVAIEDENGTETASLKGANGENGATLELKDKDGENGLTLDGGKGTITGISDVNDETPDDAAVNKKYVDTLAKSSKTEIESIDGSVNIEERRDDVNNNIIYDISVNKGTLSVTPEGEVSADKKGNAFVTAENAADAINKAAKAARTEITSGNTSILIDKNENGGLNGNDIYEISIKKDGKVEEGNDDLVTGDTVAKALDKAAKAAKTEVEAGKNVVVKERQGDNGQTIYEVSTVDRPEFKEINLKDPEKPGKESTLGPDRIVVGADQPNGKKKETIIDADGIRVKDEEGHVAKIEPTEISLGNEGEDPTVRLKAQDGDNPASLELGRNDKGEPAVKIDSANGLSGAKITLTDATGDKKIELDASKGTITGIEDATDETPASAVVNKNYVDSKLDGLGANRPFEYRLSGDITKVVVKGKDGKLYLEETIKDKVFVEGTGYVAKDLATRDELGKWNLKDPNADNTPVEALNSDDVVITAMPQDKPLTVTNIRDGKIAENSTDAINGSQLNDLATKLGLEVINDGDNKDKLFESPEFEMLKDEKGKVLKDNKSISLKDAIAKNITKLNSGLSLGADLVDDTAKDAKQYLGSKINVKAGSFEIGDVKYSDSNIKTKYTYDSETGEGTINIGITEKPVFEEVKANEAVKVADDILLVKGSEDNKPTLAFTKGNGQILGLSNADDTTPDNAAVNKKYVDSKVAKIDGVSSGIANAIALANLTQVQHRGGYRHQISGGYGTYNGEHAFGLGLSGISKGGQIMYKVSGSLNTRGKFAAGVGIGYQFDKEEIIEDELVTELRNQAKKSKEETDKLRNELDANSKETNKLRNELNANIKEIRELKEELTNLTKQVSKNYKELKQDMYMVNAYDVDSYTLNDRQIRELKAIIADLNENHKNKIIDVTGYADITSNEKYNLEIGLDRARFVVEKLIEFGLDESIVIRKISSYGHNSIIDTNGNQKGRLTNRRVEISVK